MKHALVRCSLPLASGPDSVNSELSSAGTQSRARRMAVLALLMGALAMGVSPLFVRLSNLDGVGPFASAFWRVTLALPILWSWAKLEERQAGGAPRPTFTWPAVLSGLLFAGYLLLWHISILATTIAN